MEAFEDAGPRARSAHAITWLLDHEEDIRNVQKFSRHARLDTLQLYDDRRNDVAGRLACKLAASGRPGPASASSAAPQGD